MKAGTIVNTMGQGINYLDYAAATPLDERVFLAMKPYFSDIFYNPSASYAGGQQARQALEDARRRVALQLGAKPNDVIFTAGATESIHLALAGVLSQGGHAVIGATEHPSVYETVAAFSHTIAPADSRGVVSPESVEKSLTSETTVVSVCMADSELGTVQPLRDIATVLENERQKRREAGNKTPLYFHTDASQGATALDIKTSRLGVDMLSLNAAKCYGPKQVGALWLASHVRLQPVFHGGKQERSLRSGTENVAGVVGFATALELAQASRHAENARLQKLREILAKELLESLPDLVIDGHPKRHLPGHLHVHVPGLDAERVVFRLDGQSVYVATGAACSASKHEPSKTLVAVGLSESERDGSLRLTLGKYSTEESVRLAAEKLIEAVEKERGL